MATEKTTKTKVKLIYDWVYRVYGENYKRNYEYPITVQGRSLQTIHYNPALTILSQKEEIKAQMKKFIIDDYRAKAMEEWDRPETETLWKEEFRFENIREATQWSDLEDFIN
jgi:hypothetical protein